MTGAVAAPPGATVPVLEVRKVNKNFNAVRALVDVDLTVRPREVVALVGDNAAGKSTLARIISGVLAPDTGTLRLGGRETVIESPGHAYRLGIASVFQELALCDNLDVVANLFLGREMSDSGLLDEEVMERLTRSYLDRLGSRVPSVRTSIANLTACQRQCVAIARTLVGEPRLVVLDEPTAALSVLQISEVLGHIERLREMGLGVILISHSLNDVRAVADRIEVLRHGRNNGSFDAKHASSEEIIAAITGVTRHWPQRPRRTAG